MLKRVFCSVANLFVFMGFIEVVFCELPSEQVSAMTRIYEIIQNDTAPSFVWNNVLKNSNPCLWQGVFCSPDNSSISNISFTSFSISTSEFLPFLCNITTLESLDVSNNRLSSIPQGFYSVCGKISGLKLLTFSGNKFHGSLLIFNGFTMLEYLDFSENSFSGEISLQLDGLGSLKSLDFSKNNFMSSIPTNLGKMNLLEELLLSGNSFTGEIPVEITKYKNLRVIDFSRNGLSGSIPVELGELIRLETLVLSTNNLSGSIPASLSNITTLKRFAAHQNKFIGTIPPEITSYLGILDLSYNKLTGTVSSDLLSGENLQFLDLSFNELEGPIPAINSTKLLRLRLRSNSLNGTIPSDSLRSLVELMYLELDDNRLTGEIPFELGLCKKLALLNLAQNKFTGTLPPVLGDLTNLEVLSLELNNFVGAIPSQILQLTRLDKLKINENSLNGSIPSSISRLKKLSYLDLQGNNLSGPIPDSIGNLSSLIELQLGNNQLSGQIPDMPLALRVALNLSYNIFTGHIPVNLSELEGLEVLDLSNNRFSGEIPGFLVELSSLTHLLLMNNELTGVIPEFGSHVEVDTRGNSDLIDPRENPSPAPQRKKISIDSDSVIAVASGMPVGLLISVIAIFISRRYNRIHGHLSPPNSIHRSTIDFKKAMEAVADRSNITLKARCSTFYKSVMPSGTTYLVKKVNHTNMLLQFPRHEQLLEELEVVGNLCNSNVMIPIAYVLTVHRAYLFYDFVRGTLYDLLHHRMGSTLDWPSRYNIAVGVAKGLSYLHECSPGPIILLDLCSKSILLKSVDEPQISDIELCNLIHPSKTRGIVGSAGYIPPEYGSTKKVTAAGNVYSFGVVLLELLTGKPAVSGETELAKWVLSSSKQRNKWHEILDSSVGETSVGVRNQMVAVVEVALACISMSPEIRPNTLTVLQMLLSRRLHS